MNENTKTTYRTSAKHICPCCCGPLKIQDIGGEVNEVLLWCPSPSCHKVDITEGQAASKLASYGIQAATEDAAFAELENKMAAMPERPCPDIDEDEDAGSWR